MNKRTKSKRPTSQDIYDIVTAKIIKQLEEGVRPWEKPWNANNVQGRVSRPLRKCGTPFQGINILVLWDAALEFGYSSPYWLTFKQAKELGGTVMKGEKGTRVVFASTFEKNEEDDRGEAVTKKIPFLKTYTSFNAAQIEGLPQSYYQEPDSPSDSVEPLAYTETFFDNIGAEVRYGGAKAYYAKGGDFIRMPKIEMFKDAEGFTSTLAHEHCHWSGHPARLNRDLSSKRWGDESYAAEELIAELGAAFLCADLGIFHQTRDDHTSYIQSWLKILKNDKRAIFTAASQASKAVDYLHEFQK